MRLKGFGNSHNDIESGVPSSYENDILRKHFSNIDMDWVEKPMIEAQHSKFASFFSDMSPQFNPTAET